MIALAGLAFGLGLSTEFWILDWRNWETLSNGGQIVDTECDECCSGPMTGAMAGEDGSRWIGISNIGDLLVARGCRTEAVKPQRSSMAQGKARRSNQRVLLLESYGLG